MVVIYYPSSKVSLRSLFRIPNIYSNSVYILTDNAGVGYIHTVMIGWQMHNAAFRGPILVQILLFRMNKYNIIVCGF